MSLSDAHRNARLAKVTLPGGGTVSKGEDGRIAVAGRESLRILRLLEPSVPGRQPKIESSRNLWEGSGLKIDCASTDVAWAYGVFNNKILTSARNGELIMWDLNKSGHSKYERKTKEHLRSIHAMTVSRVVHHYCMTGSADGDFRVWDLRDIQSSVMRVHNPSAVRRVIFSPCVWNPLFVVVGMDNGTLHRWDLKMGQKGLLDRLPVAHTAPITTMDWYSGSYGGDVSQGISISGTQGTEEYTGNTLGWFASAGLDRCAKIWNLTGPDATTRMPNKPTYTLHASYPIRRILWRPSYDCELAVVSHADFTASTHVEHLQPPPPSASASSTTATTQGLLSRVGSGLGIDTSASTPPATNTNTEVRSSKEVKAATTVEHSIPILDAVEIWDVRRSWIPKWSVVGTSIEGGVTDIEFSDSQTLLTQNINGTFMQVDLRDVTKPLDCFDRNVGNWNQDGSLVFVSDNVDGVRWEVPYDDIQTRVLPSDGKSTTTTITKKKIGERPYLPKTQKLGTYVSSKVRYEDSVFRMLAASYVIVDGNVNVTDRDRAKLCEVNMEVAKDVGKTHIAQIWSMMQICLMEVEKEYDENALLLPTPPPTPPPTSVINPTGLGSGSGTRTPSSILASASHPNSHSHSHSNSISLPPTPIPPHRQGQSQSQSQSPNTNINTDYRSPMTMSMSRSKSQSQLHSQMQSRNSSNSSSPLLHSIGLPLLPLLPIPGSGSVSVSGFGNTRNTMNTGNGNQMKMKIPIRRASFLGNRSRGRSSVEGGAGGGGGGGVVSRKNTLLRRQSQSQSQSQSQFQAQTQNQAQSQSQVQSPSQSQSQSQSMSVSVSISGSGPGPGPGQSHNASPIGSMSVKNVGEGVLSDSDSDENGDGDLDEDGNLDDEDEYENDYINRDGDEALNENENGGVGVSVGEGVFEDEEDTELDANSNSNSDRGRLGGRVSVPLPLPVPFGVPSPLSKVLDRKGWIEDEYGYEKDEEDEDEEEDEEGASPSPRSTDTESEGDKFGYGYGSESDVEYGKGEGGMLMRRKKQRSDMKRNSSKSKKKSRSRSSTLASLAAGSIPTPTPPSIISSSILTRVGAITRTSGNQLPMKALVHHDSGSSIRTITAAETSFNAKLNNLNINQSQEQEQRQPASGQREREREREENISVRNRMKHQHRNKFNSNMNQKHKKKETDREKEQERRNWNVDVINEYEENVKRHCWDMIKEAFEEFLEIGDVQMCASMAVIARDELGLSNRRLLHVYDTYIEQMMRQKLFTSAAYFRKHSGIEQIKNMTLLDTTIHTTCGKCEKPIIRPVGKRSTTGSGGGNQPQDSWKLPHYSECLGCKTPVAICTICRLPVRKMLFQCSICHHGGHQSCYRQYYLSEPMHNIPPTSDLLMNEDRGRSYSRSFSGSGNGNGETSGSRLAGHLCAAGCGHYCWATLVQAPGQQ